jgi:cytoskeletal protein CcmA (bactofilin family)
MIGSRNRSTGATNNMDNGINRIVEGTVIEGVIKSESSLRIDGEFTGELITKGRLVVGPKGKVQGTVHCLCCDVEGTLEGEITVLELLAMKSTSTVQGDLYYGQLSVEAGAKALGTFRMGVAEDVKPSAQTASKADAMASLESSRIPSETEQKQAVEA